MVNRSQRGGNHLISQNIELFLVIAISIGAAADGAKLGCRIRPGDGRRQFNRNPGQSANRRRHGWLVCCDLCQKFCQSQSCHPVTHICICGAVKAAEQTSF